MSHWKVPIANLSFRILFTFNHSPNDFKTQLQKSSGILNDQIGFCCYKAWKVDTAIQNMSNTQHSLGANAQIQLGKKEHPKSIR